jgi:hypothetical protein
MSGQGSTERPLRLSAFTKYGPMAASTRQRLLQYIPHLERAGIRIDCHALLADDYVQSIATGGGFSKAEIARSYLRRMRTLMGGASADLIWVYAELFPYLPASFERLAFRSGRPVIYDFDDAFFHQYDDHPQPLLRRALAGKLEPLVRGAKACACGNAYLEAYAQQFNDRTILLPTVVDGTLYRTVEAERPEQGLPVIGWIGSPSTYKYLQPLLPLLERFVEGKQASVLIVGAGKAAEADRRPGFDFRDWTEESEVGDVQSMDIGLMPLPDEKWARGKSGYKLVQYMACGLPVVASPVGVNSEIVRQQVTGYLAESSGDWHEALARLLRDPALRRAMGMEGRRRFEEHYSLEVHAPRLISLIRESVGERAR